MKGASQIAPLGVRLPDELKEKVQERAKEHGRSMNAEIVGVIEKSFSEQPNQEALAMKSALEHLQAINELKDQIIASQESSIKSQKETISSLHQTISSLHQTIDAMERSIDAMDRTIKSLEDHVRILQSHVKTLGGNP
ncbi:putative phage regulatory protein [Yersinia intermedia]|uniref:Arc family DNA-binding protein n=1 Tax=Yersinia intermedia TaxID=631 RepID=UPI0005DBD32D|nr:Arc family DNA-binding protein [Yersinia intermedia]CNJ80295.1 putative phage regulatory protein [Yersinia intermedia]